jgi:hypothetical protein
MLFHVVAQFLTVHHDPAALVFLQPVDAADGGGFAGAGRAADDDSFTLCTVKLMSFST